MHTPSVGSMAVYICEPPMPEYIVRNKVHGFGVNYASKYTGRTHTHPGGKRSLLSDCWRAGWLGEQSIEYRVIAILKTLSFFPPRCVSSPCIYCTSA